MRTRSSGTTGSHHRGERRPERRTRALARRASVITTTTEPHTAMTPADDEELRDVGPDASRDLATDPNAPPMMPTPRARRTGGEDLHEWGCPMAAPGGILGSALDHPPRRIHEQGLIRVELVGQAVAHHQQAQRERKGSDRPDPHRNGGQGLQQLPTLRRRMRRPRTPASLPPAATFGQPTAPSYISARGRKRAAVPVGIGKERRRGGVEWSETESCCVVPPGR